VKNKKSMKISILDYFISLKMKYAKISNEVKKKKNFMFTLNPTATDKPLASSLCT